MKIPHNFRVSYLAIRSLQSPNLTKTTDSKVSILLSVFKQIVFGCLTFPATAGVHPFYALFLLLSCLPSVVCLSCCAVRAALKFLYLGRLRACRFGYRIEGEMRLSRAALLLSKTGLYHRLERCKAIQTPPSVKHHVIVERLILSHGSKMSWRYKSYVASSPSVSVKDGKSRGRVSRNERKAMVENYVRKYREMKPGMFPTVSDAQKEVGGSYYVVRDIIQELKYKSSIASLEATVPNTGSISEQELPKENLSSIRSKNKRQFRSIGSHLKHGKPEGVETQPCCLNDEPTVSLDSENNGSESKLTLQEEPKSTPKESGVSERDLHQLHVQDLEAPSKSSVWQSLKSFANGILGIWKRS